MPIRYERDDARRRVVVTVKGPYALADFLALIERQRGDNASAYGVLYDLRGMTGEPSVADLRRAMSQARYWNGGLLQCPQSVQNGTANAYASDYHL